MRTAGESDEGKETKCQEGGGLRLDKNPDNAQSSPSQPIAASALGAARPASITEIGDLVRPFLSYLIIPALTGARPGLFCRTIPSTALTQACLVCRGLCAAGVAGQRLLGAAAGAAVAGRSAGAPAAAAPPHTPPRRPTTATYFGSGRSYLPPLLARRFANLA